MCVLRQDPSLGAILLMPPSPAWRCLTCLGAILLMPLSPAWRGLTSPGGPSPMVGQWLFCGC